LVGLVGTGQKIMLSVLVNLGGFAFSRGFGIYPRTKNAHLLNATYFLMNLIELFIIEKSALFPSGN